MTTPTSRAVDDAIERLRSAWLTHVTTDESAFRSIVGRHRERHRRYHTIQHVDAVVSHARELIDEIGNRPCDVGAIVAAAIYHDAVYEPKSPANERASARLAHRDLTRFDWAPSRVDAVCAMIEGTATHTGAPDLDTAVLFDADLSILGADHIGYAAYVEAVRAEYRHVDDDAWATGRLSVLRALLERDAIYSTEPGIGRWESTARSNLVREIAELSARANAAGDSPESE